MFLAVNINCIPTPALAVGLTGWAGVGDGGVGETAITNESGLAITDENGNAITVPTD